MFLHRGTSNMWRDPSGYCLLLVFVLMCSDSVLSESYGNFSGAAANYRKVHRPHHKPHTTMETPQEYDPDENRFPKLFSFNALDDDVSVDLEFAVPFIHIPIKKGMDATNKAFKSLVNLNTPALVVSGLFIVLGAGFGLVFNSLVGKTTAAGIKRKSRITDISSLLDPFKLVYRSGDAEKSETAFGELMELIEGKFSENNVDITACIQKSICSFVKKASDRVRGGRATGTNKIIDGLATSEWLLQYLEGTAVKDAIDAGNGIANCSYKYATCRWSSPEKQIMDLAWGFLEF